MSKLGCENGLDGWEKKFCDDARNWWWWLQEKGWSMPNDLSGRSAIFDKLKKEKERARQEGGLKNKYDPSKEDFSFEGFIDGLGCGFGAQYWDKETCGEAYAWWWRLSDDKKDPNEALEAGHKKTKFYDLQRDKRKNTGEERKRVPMPKRPTVVWTYYDQPTAPKQAETPKQKEQPKKKKTKPGTFGYYGWYVDWGI
ncbi:hypothetical protein [Candidatus Mycoplasma haematohominis]|nr:hypothetical protein [Candidatus Mycoplasma haemohominis]